MEPIKYAAGIGLGLTAFVAALNLALLFKSPDNWLNGIVGILCLASAIYQLHAILRFKE